MVMMIAAHTIPASAIMGPVPICNTSFCDLVTKHGKQQKSCQNSSLANSLFGGELTEGAYWKQHIVDGDRRSQL
jgi:ligand-binding sensor protein